MAKRKANGEGTVFRRPNGTWSAQVSYIDPATNQRKRKTVSGKTKQEVLQKKRELETLKDNGRLVDSGKITVSAWLDRWLEVYKKPALKPSTWFSYKQLADLHIKPGLGERQLDRLQASEIQAFYNRLAESGRKIKEYKTPKKKDKKAAERKTPPPGLSTRTVRYIHTVLSGALNQAMKENLIKFNPAMVTEPPRLSRKEVHPLTAEQARAFLEAIKHDMIYPIIFTDLGTGLRRGELLGLKWNDIDLKNGTAVIRRSLLQLQGKVVLQEDTKTRSSRASIKLPGEVVKVLKKVKAQQAKDKLALPEGVYKKDGFVFCWPDGTYIRPDFLYHRFKALLKEHGLPEVRLHDLRHTFCTLLLEAGEDLATVSKLARHSSYSITADIYGHLTKTMQDRAAGKMDAILKGR